MLLIYHNNMLLMPPVVEVNPNMGWHQTSWKQTTQRITSHKRKSLPSAKIDYNQENLLAQIAQEDLMAIEVIVAFVTMET